MLDQNTPLTGLTLSEPQILDQIPLPQPRVGGALVVCAVNYGRLLRLGEMRLDSASYAAINLQCGY